MPSVRLLYKCIRECNKAIRSNDDNEKNETKEKILLQLQDIQNMTMYNDCSSGTIYTLIERLKKDLEEKTHQRIKEYIAIVISIIGIAMAYCSYRQSKTASEFAQRAMINTDEPRIRIESIVYDPESVKIFTTDSSGWGNASGAITDDMCVMIRRTANSISMCQIAGEKYLTINLTDEEDEIDDILVMLDVLEIKYKNTVSNDIREFRLVNAYSKVSDQNIFGNKMINAEVDQVFKGTESFFLVKIAYICNRYDTASLKYDYFRRHEKSDEAIDLIKSPEKANDIINFRESAYLYTMEGKSGTKYDCVISFCVDEYGYISVDYYSDGDAYRRAEENATNITR